jgi:myo-inositol-1(or 4)-monophosphatase
MDLPVSATGAQAIDVARACSAEAGWIIRDGFGRVGVSETKGRGNVLTATDLAVERAVTEILQAHFPEHAILSEETATDTRSDGWMWVVDPVDGTKNFSQGIPHIAFTIALCFANEPQLALTMHPIANWEFTAVRGDGARCNGEPMHVSANERLADAVFAIDMGYDAERGRRQLELALHLWPGMQSLRVSGSAALGFAFVAAGKWDLFVHSDLQPWDSAAGLLLVSEAGGRCVDRDGGPATIRSKGVVCGSEAILADFGRLSGGLAWR